MKLVTKMNNGTLEVSVDDRIAPIGRASYNPTIEQMEAIQRNTDAQNSAANGASANQEAKQKVSTSRKK